MGSQEGGRGGERSEILRGGCQEEGGVVLGGFRRWGKGGKVWMERRGSETTF